MPTGGRIVVFVERCPNTAVAGFIGCYVANSVHGLLNWLAGYVVIFKGGRSQRAPDCAAFVLCNGSSRDVVVLRLVSMRRDDVGAKNSIVSTTENQLGAAANTGRPKPPLGTLQHIKLWRQNSHQRGWIFAISLEEDPFCVVSVSMMIKHFAQSV